MSYDEKFSRAEQSGQQGVFERIDATHPVDIFLGLEGHQRTIMIVCPKRPPQPPVLSSISVEARPRHGEEWALVLRLIKPELKALFTRLVEDLDNATRQRPTDPGEVVIARLVRWQRLLSHGNPDVLGDNELCGLVGELDFLLNEAIANVGPQLAVFGWRGPFDAPKDFVFEDVEVEVKSIGRQRGTLAISSLEQLTDAGLPLRIWCRVVELTVTTPGDPSSIPSLVSRVRDALSHHPEAADGLERCLAAAMWEDKPEYDSRGVRFGPAVCYAVQGSFPRMQRHEVASGITACRYELALDDLEPFKLTTWRVGTQSHE